ncbi:hypothetical protein OC861_000277 [Tilletia horrida]|nr:hypothetical protein OC861_000277 [Tilletia horrida]
MTTSPPLSQGALLFANNNLPSSGKSTDSNALSTSFGAAGSVLSLSASVPSSGLLMTQRQQKQNGPRSGSTNGGVPVFPDRTDANGGHTHLGVPCNMAASPPNAESSILSQSLGSRINGGSGGIKRTSSTLSADDDEGMMLDDGSSLDKHSHGKGEIHKCETCSKVYRHPSCLVKHRWEHTIHWRESSKLSGSKHQTVQLLEAAAILVGMESPARSLPEEKALWPAAVSPPSSGLLGSDKVNFVKLMTTRPPMSTSASASSFTSAHPTPSKEQFSPLMATNQQQLATQQDEEQKYRNGPRDSTAPLSPLSTASELSRSANSQAFGGSSFGSATPTFTGGTLSPLNSLGNLMLSSPPTRPHDPRNGNLNTNTSLRPNHHQHPRRTSVTGKHPNMVGYIRSTSATNINTTPTGTTPHSGSTPISVAGRFAAVTASNAAGRASKKAAKTSNHSSSGDDADSDVKILHLDWDSSSHSDRTESDDRGSRSGRSGSAETEATSGEVGLVFGEEDDEDDALSDEEIQEGDHVLKKAGGGSEKANGNKNKANRVGDGRAVDDEHDEADDNIERDDEDDDDEEADREDEEDEDSSRSFGDADGMDAMEMDGVE